MDDLITIRIDSAYKEILQELAKKDKRTLSDYVRILLETHIDEAEDK